MGMLGTSKKRQAKHRLRDLEKKLDLKDLEKRLGKIDLKDLEKRFDLKDLEKRFDIDTEDLAKRYRDLRLARHHEERESSSAGFIAGLVVGAIVGVVLAIIFGKKNSGEVMDQFAHRAESLRDTASERYHQARGDGAQQGESNSALFGEGAAIEREVNGDAVDTARDTIDSASEDVKGTVEDVKDSSDNLADGNESRNA